MTELPDDLLRYIADSEVEIVSWSSSRDELVLRIRKEIGPEVGVLRLQGVSLIHLAPRFEVVAIGAYDRPFPDFPHLEFDEGEFVVVFQDAWGAAYFVKAESVEYTKTVGP